MGSYYFLMEVKSSLTEIKPSGTKAGKCSARDTTTSPWAGWAWWGWTGPQELRVPLVGRDRDCKDQTWVWPLN